MTHLSTLVVKTTVLDEVQGASVWPLGLVPASGLALSNIDEKIFHERAFMRVHEPELIVHPRLFYLLLIKLTYKSHIFWQD